MTVLRERIPLALCVLAGAFAARALTMAVLPLTDSTEGRYAQVAQEMTLAGDWVTPRVWMYGENLPFMGKPPLYFWSAAAAMKLCGVNAFAARLPSLLAALALLWLLHHVMERYGEKGSGLFSVMVTASCGFFFAVSGVVAIDVLLSACVAGSLLAYFAFTCEPSRAIRKRWSLLVFALLALGFLTKGPVAVVLFGLPVLLWTIRWRQWGLLKDHCWIGGVLLFLLVVTPWFVLCEQRNPGFLKYFFLNENLLRFVRHDYGDAYGSGHLYPRGSALWMFAAAAAPWSLFALVWRVRERWVLHTATPADKRDSFLFLGAFAGVLFWCMARQLLITYTLPLVPIFAAWFARKAQNEPAVYRRVIRVSIVLLLLQGCLSVAVIPFLQNTCSTRHVVRHAQRYAKEHALKGPLLFAGKTPYSALFYARGWVMPHPKEPLAVTLSTCRKTAGSVLLIFNKRHASVLAGLPVQNVEKVATLGEWELAHVILPEPGVPLPLLPEVSANGFPPQS